MMQTGLQGKYSMVLNDFAKRSLLLFALVFLIMPVDAHPGRTDENGGHYNRSTGEYHYHHGYPAHQHTGGVCQYAYDDKTGKQPWSSDISNHSKFEDDNSILTEEVNDDSGKSNVIKNPTSDSKEEPILDRILIAVFLLIIVGPIIFSILYQISIIIYVALDSVHAFDKIRKRKKERHMKND